jgi:hypothetical protein
METLKTKNRATSTFLTKLLKNESLLWSLLFRIKLIHYSFKELRSLFFALCLYLQTNIEIWCLTILLKTGNIVHELVTESFTKQKARLTIVHERLFSINRLVPLLIIPSFTNKLIVGKKITNTGYGWRPFHSAQSIELSKSSSACGWYVVTSLWKKRVVVL